jgi:hypothetical protein
MSSNEFEFFLKRGENAEWQGDSEVRDSQWDKARKLYMQSFGWFKKAYGATTDVAKRDEIKAKLAQVKKKHDDLPAE